METGSTGEHQAELMSGDEEDKDADSAGSGGPGRGSARMSMPPSGVLICTALVFTKHLYFMVCELNWTSLRLEVHCHHYLDDWSSNTLFPKVMASEVGFRALCLCLLVILPF